jgi:hypothetical protein
MRFEIVTEPHPEIGKAGPRLLDTYKKRRCTPTIIPYSE